LKDKDQIQELFSNNLGKHEATVRPDLWNGIASQITTGASASVGISVLTKIIISTISVAAISTAVVLYSTQDSKLEKESKTIQNDSKMIVFDEKEPVSDENKIISPIIEDENEDLSRSTSEDVLVPELKDVIIQENENTLSDVNKSDSQQGVLKERTEGSESVTTENTTISDEDSHKEEVAYIEKTEFPIDLEKENLVEGYTISKMPDVFSPNNDGQNDLLFISSDGISDFSIVIMDENSKVVYKSSDVDFKWDGVDLYGNLVETGHYIYFITGNDRNGNPVSKYQSLTIVR